MSTVYLIRHGQAGARTDYDKLSDLGWEQARRLGRTFLAHQMNFTALVSGALTRQQETAAAVTGAWREAALPCPEIVTDTLWNEFDLDAVYRDIAPQLCAADPAFRALHDEMLGQMADPAHPVHRQWSKCDLPVLRAWVSGRYPTECESWEQFQQRIGRALAGLERFGPDDRVAVFTSATPTAIACAIALRADVRTRLQLTGALYNSAYSTLKRHDGAWLLGSFNNIPHLDDPRLRTFR